MRKIKTEVRLSPKYVNNMMMFKEFITKKKVTYDPVIERIYGKINLERELLCQEVSQAQLRCKSQGRVKRRDKDYKLLSQLEKDFKKHSIRTIPHYGYQQESEIKQSIHEQVLNSDINSVVVQEFSTPLSKKHFQILNTLQPEPSFKYKVQQNQPLKRAQELLSQNKKMRQVYENQLIYEREYLGLTDMQEMSKTKGFKINSFHKSIFKKSIHQNLMDTITTSCRNEKSEFAQILRKCNKVQGKFKSCYEGMLDQYNSQIK